MSGDRRSAELEFSLSPVGPRTDLQAAWHPCRAKSGFAETTEAQFDNSVASVAALGRVGMPADIGGAVAALLSDGSRWVNAQRIEVSGGMFV